METPLEKLIRLSGERHVRTPEGARRFGKPIGARITASDLAKVAEKTGRIKPLAPSHNQAQASPVPHHKQYGPHNRAPVDLSKTSAMQQSKMDAKTYVAHARYIERTVNEQWDTVATHKTHSNGERGQWTPERAELHRQIVNDLWRDAANVPNEGKALFSGGLSGAGKTTVLEQYAGVDLERYFVLNVDDIKELMAQRGMVPEVKGLSPMEASTFVHVEATHIAKILLDMAKAEKKNVLRDVTMAGAGNGATTAKERVDELIEAGYTVDSVFVDIPVALSQQRVLSRHRKGMEEHAAGKGLGGRYVPLGVVKENAPKEGSPYMSSNRQVFEDLKPLFGNWRIYDNSVNGRAPELIDGTRGWEGSVGSEEIARKKREEKQSRDSNSVQPMSQSDKLAAGIVGTAMEQVKATARRKVDEGPLF